MGEHAIVIELTDPGAADPARTGGKGANLARLARAGLPVLSIPFGYLGQLPIKRYIWLNKGSHGPGARSQIETVHNRIPVLRSHYVFIVWSGRVFKRHCEGPHRWIFDNLSRSHRSWSRSG